jgi:Holliday junction resolvase
VTGYDKGARSERELLNILYEQGYSVTRSAGSGVNALSPDLVAMRKGKCLVIECKAWEKGSLAIGPEQFEKMLEWEQKTEFPVYVAWRMNGMGWFFLKLDEFERGKSNYNITKKKTLALGRKLGSITGDGAAATSQK